MELTDVLNLIGGLALFLFGMNAMGDGLEKLSGGKLEKLLEKMTSNTFKGFLVGMLVTAVIQSSSATTVMVVGFVNSGIMKLSRAIGVIMGANVGTTITAWILSLSGIEGDSLLMTMLKPTSFSPILAIIGIILIMFFGKSQKNKDIGGILIGFAILMFGMDMMSDSVAGLKDVPEFGEILLMFSNPVFGILAGALLTAIIQSSSASVGILQALSATGEVTFGTAIPIIMGQNIGTCATAMISCIGAKKNARRAAYVHLYFNIIGTAVLLAVFYIAHAIIDFAFLDNAIDEAGIAIVHTTFNICATALLLPFNKVLEKLACMTVKDKEVEDDTPFIDERLLATPSVATSQCVNMSNTMAKLSEVTITDACAILAGYTEELATKIQDDETKIDVYEDVLGTYLVKLSTKTLSERDSAQASKMLHSIGDFERISDHAVSIMKASKEMHEKGISFSESAVEELDVLVCALIEIVDNTIKAYVSEDLELAKQIEPLEQVIDKLVDELKLRHIKRLRDGKCTIELGFIFSDLLTDIERVSDHCSNIAVCMIETSEESFETHEYLNELRHGDDSTFKADYKAYRNKYVLP
ncbi:MAG: Na/Pi cotransporter family protein [Acutalibacteraceae bacterium]|nr:Na/Pi cotransporter family protein [Acutalibacteraceae bacterium]